MAEEIQREQRSSITLKRSVKGERDRRIVEMAMTPPGFTLKELGQAFGLTPQTICNTLRAAGVSHTRPRKPSLSSGRAGDLHSQWKGDAATDRAARYRSHVVIRELGICEECGVSKATDRHHIDGNPKHNDRANLRALCRGCHNRAHGRVPPWRKQTERSSES
jgi:5-methylcytosine-specific restriction endonuclease McrA